MPFPESYDGVGLDEMQLRAFFALMDVASLLRRQVEQQLKKSSDLTYAQYKVLARLGLDAPDGTLRMSELAEEVVYSPSGLTYQAEQMERAGLVERAPSQDDDRGVTVTITDTGRARLADAVPGHVDVLRALLFEPLTDDHTRALSEMLEPVLDHMRVAATRPPRRRRRTKAAES